MSKTALIFGATGLVGSELLSQILEKEEYQRVRIFVRKYLLNNHPKLEQIFIDYDNLNTISDKLNGDDIFICLGTTMKIAGSKEAFYKVDYTYCHGVAKMAKDNGVHQVILISSMGADVRSSIYYSKVKGEIERDISILDFDATIIVRPSLLLGDRQEKRFGEQIFMKINQYFGFVFIGPFAKYKPITAHSVAKSMIKLAQSNIKGISINESNNLQKLAL